MFQAREEHYYIQTFIFLLKNDKRLPSVGCVFIYKWNKQKKFRIFNLVNPSTLKFI